MLSLLLAGMAVVVLLYVPVVPVRSGAPTEIHLDLEGSPPPKPNLSTDVGPGIPPNCSTWHELWPVYCAPHHQSGYEDSDGSGTISPCDIIHLGTVPWHVKWVGPTYFVTCFPPDGGPPTALVFEPETSNTGENPICEVWHEVHPNFCRTIHIDSWHDTNGNGVLDVCDEVDVQVPGVGTFIYHIDRIGCDIIVQDPRTPSRQSSWGWLKDQFLR
jgi:hypothetical protein